MQLSKINEVTISGRVSDVRIQTSQYGNYGDITVGYNDDYKNKAGEWVKRPYFFTIKVNQSVLEKFHTQPVKGDYVVLSGKLVMDTWQDKNDGTNRSAVRVSAAKLVSHVPKVVIGKAQQAGLMAGGQNEQAQSNPQTNGYQTQQARPAQNGYANQGNGMAQKPPMQEPQFDSMDDHVPF